VSLKDQLQDAVKTAMKEQAKDRLGTLRMVMAAIKQKEVDERITLNDTQILAVLDKMVKERRESIKQFEAGNRQDLIDKENSEITILQEFLPTALTPAEIQKIISDAMQQAQPKSMQDMGKVMAIVKPQLQGRADMAAVSALIKEKIAAAN
jgi:hypothetical protein